MATETAIPTTEDIEQWLLALGYSVEGHCAQVMPDGRVAWLLPLIFTTAIVIGPFGSDDGYDDRWCYKNRGSALLALRAWVLDGTEEPTGWHRNPKTGRRRPEGDPEKEYVNL